MFCVKQNYFKLFMVGNPLFSLGNQILFFQIELPLYYCIYDIYV